ncbi:MAG TPA: NAD(P)-binding protein, partial [Cyclobacteriaceae bacterium]
MHLNNKAKEQNTYDAIVVGSGISGGWAAKELCEKGLKVLLLERGAPLVHPNYPTATLDPWQIDNRNRLTQEDREKHHIQTRHYSIAG